MLQVSKVRKISFFVHIIFHFFSRNTFIWLLKAWAQGSTVLHDLPAFFTTNIISAPSFLSLSRCLSVILSSLSSSCLAQSPHVKLLFVPALWFMSAGHLSLVQGLFLSLHCNALVSLCKLNPSGKSKCLALVEYSLITCFLLPSESSFLSRSSFYNCWFLANMCCFHCPPNYVLYSISDLVQSQGLLGRTFFNNNFLYVSSVFYSPAVPVL